MRSGYGVVFLPLSKVCKFCLSQSRKARQEKIFVLLFVIQLSALASHARHASKAGRAGLREAFY
jgi:hypothetical protein